MPPDGQSDPEKETSREPGEKKRPFQRMPLPAAVEEGEEGQQGHGGGLNREPEKFVGEELQDLVVGQEMPFRLDVCRCQQGVGGQKGFRSKEESRGEKDHAQVERHTEGDGGEILQGIIGKEGDTAGVIFVMVLSPRQRVGRVAATEGRRGDADALEQEEMGADPEHQQDRDSGHMQGKETTEGSGADQLSAPQKLHQFRADKGNGVGAVGGHCRRPERELAPGEEIAGQGTQLHQGNKDKAGDPVQLARALVAPHEEDREEVKEEGHYHQVRADHMTAADQPAAGDVVHDEAHAPEGFFGVRHVIDEEEDAGHHLQGQEAEEDTPQRIPGIDVARQQVAGQLLLHEVAHADADVDPVNETFKEGHTASISADSNGAIRHGDGEPGQRLRRRTGDDIPLRGEATGMAGTKEILLLLFPLDDAAQMGTDSRQR